MNFATSPAPTDRLKAVQEQVLAAYQSGNDELALSLLETLGCLAPPGSAARRQYHYYRTYITAFRRGDAAAGAEMTAQATAEFPNDRDFWFFRGRVLAQLQQQAPALRALKRTLKLSPEHGQAMYESAKILHRANRKKMALKTGLRARELGVEATYLFEMLAANHFYLGNARACVDCLDLLEARGVANTYLAFLRERAETALETRRRRALGQGARPARHIAIGASPYVGSTLLGALLGSTPGSAHAGETQELTRRFDWERRTSVAIDFETAAPESYSNCRLCGPECHVLTRSFREKLSHHPFDFYNQLANRLDVTTLITSDKTLTEYISKDPLFEFDLIILYKTPVTWIRSRARQEAARVRSGLAKAGDVGDVASWLREWAQTYEGFMDMPIPLSRSVAVNWDRFVATPHAHFEQLLRRLGLEGDASVFENIRMGHFVGGNSTDNVLQVMRDGRVTFKPSDAPILTANEEAEVTNNPVVLRVARRLDARYQLDFGRLAGK